MKQLRCTIAALVLRATPNGTDTGKRVLKDQLVLAYGESYDRKWLYVTAPAGAGWASAEYLEGVPPLARTGLAVVPRAKWGAKHGAGNATQGAKALVIVHHFATPDVSADASEAQERETMQGVERHHAVTNKWAGIGYNFVVFQSGRIYEGRGWGRTGAHSPGNNSKSVGIAFAINGELHPLSEAARAAFRALVSEGIKRGFVAPAFVIKGHRDFQDTSCPGDKVYAQLGGLR